MATPTMRKARIQRFVFYAFMGAMGTAAQYLILVALVSLHVCGPVVASSLGMIAGACVNYALNYRFTFRSNAGHKHAMPRFMAIATFGFAINLFIMSVLTGRFQYLAAQLVSTFAVLLFTYSANSSWSFKR